MSQTNSSSKRNWREHLISWPRGPKRVLLVLGDFCLLSLALWTALSLRLSTFYYPISIELFALLLAAPISGVIVFWQMGLYRLVTRYISHQGTVRIFLAVTLSVLVWALIVLMSGLIGVPRSVVLMYGLLAAFFVWISRQFAGWILKGVPYAVPARFGSSRKNVLIYGAGTTGIQLHQALEKGDKYHTVGFVDEEKSLWGQKVSGRKVFRPKKIANLIQQNNIAEIFLAIPDASRQKRKTIIRTLEPYSVVVKTLPALEDIATGRVEISDLRHIEIDDLLGRDPVSPDQSLLNMNVKDKSVLVTGAGGSIGSELTRQILKLQPRKLILLEISEVALYQIEQEISELKGALAAEARDRGEAVRDCKVVGVLGSVLDKELIDLTLAREKVETIYHAAAYKHVPIVELNPISGLRNNTFGTKIIAQSALDHGVERFVLVSTDKAVRPTNIMGASKRLAEMVLQAMAAGGKGDTVFTMVRFGNVLGSSGSVVRRFRKQISEGGPITVTHPEVIRYFMSTAEAAELVIQAGAMATGGDVFVLDMGKPVKIDDLARTMIRLMGLEAQDDTNPEGDIAIEYVGLRYGEKLYEELLIGENTTGTSHSRVMKCNEPFLPARKLDIELKELQSAMSSHERQAILDVLDRTVEGFVPDKRSFTLEDSISEDWTSISRTIH